MQVCSACGQEVRLGYRPGPAAPLVGQVEHWMHRDTSTDEDHRPKFGRLFTDEDAARVEAQRHIPYEREDGTWITPAQYEHAKMRKAKREEAEEADVDHVVVPIPDPEIHSTPIDIGDERLPGGAKSIIVLARRHLWDATATYSRGPRTHATTGALLGISDFVVVRMRLDGTPRRAVASWRDTKFEFAWTATLEPDHRYHTHAANSDVLKAWIKGE